jgi:hypothetical protein
MLPSSLRGTAGFPPARAPKFSTLRYHVPFPKIPVLCTVLVEAAPAVFFVGSSVIDLFRLGMKAVLRFRRSGKGAAMKAKNEARWRAVWALSVALSLQMIASTQQPLSVSGLVLDENGRQVVEAFVTTPWGAAKTDVYGRFTTVAKAESGTLEVAKDGFDVLSQSITVGEKSITGIEIRLVKNPASHPLERKEGIVSAADLKRMTTQALAVWPTDRDAAAKLLDSRLRHVWGDFAVEPFAASFPPLVVVAGPYAMYRLSLREAIRKMEPVDALTMTAVVTLSVEPSQRDSLDIEKIVVQRDGAIVAPVSNTLKPTTFANSFGATTVKHAGAVTFPLKAFAPGGTVVITAIPASGENVVMPQPEATLQRIR